MNFYKIIPVLLLVSSPVFADGDPSYYFKVTITTKDKKVITGYFFSWNIKIDNSNEEYYYTDRPPKMHLKLVRSKNALIVDKLEYNFFSHVKRNLQDTIYLYKDVAFYHGQGEAELYNIPMPIGMKQKILPEQIDKIIVHALYRFNLNTYMLTKIKSEDKMWVNKIPTLEESVGGYDVCNSTAICFDTHKENAHQVLQPLIQLYKKINEVFQDQEKVKILLNKISEEIERLRKLKILVYETCSC